MDRVKKEREIPTVGLSPRIYARVVVKRRDKGGMPSFLQVRRGAKGTGRVIEGAGVTVWKHPNRDGAMPADPVGDAVRVAVRAARDYGYIVADTELIQ